MRYFLTIFLSFLMVLPVLAEQIDPKQVASIVEAKAPELRRDVLVYFQNTSPEALRIVAKEPDQITLPIFPVHSHLMSPGKMTAKAVTLPQLSQPIFIIGSDDLSKAWLKEHKESLQRLKAIGFLVEVQDQSTFEIMSNMVQGLVMVPLSGDQMAAQWHIEHYPVLISQQAIEQ
jgi:integrating conjugative element protein (TIGR03765 family)